MFKLLDVRCNNPMCKFEPKEMLLTEEEIDNGIKCELCGEDLEIDFLNRPSHQRHVSWSTWRVGHGD